jgi:hypothetical protein
MSQMPSKPQYLTDFQRSTIFTLQHDYTLQSNLARLRVAFTYPVFAEILSRYGKEVCILYSRPPYLHREGTCGDGGLQHFISDCLTLKHSPSNEYFSSAVLFRFQASSDILLSQARGLIYLLASSFFSLLLPNRSLLLPSRVHIHSHYPTVSNTR